MADPFYNISYGPGMEGILNYVNEITSGWFANLFLLFIFIISMYTLTKSEWKLNSVLAFSFFLIFITSMVMRLFIKVNILIMYVAIIGLAVTVFTGLWDKQK